MFLQYFAKEAFQAGKKTLDYKNLADAVDNEECLDFLSAICPKKITVLEYKKIMAKQDDTDRYVEHFATQFYSLFIFFFVIVLTKNHQKRRAVKRERRKRKATMIKMVMLLRFRIQIRMMTTISRKLNTKLEIPLELNK
jgi:hypothetical protein